MPKLYSKKVQIGQAVANVSSFAMTMDIWTSLSKQTYIGLTIHYVDHEFKLQSQFLETKEFPEDHTDANIAEELELMLDEWKCDKQGLSAVTTDNCSNIVCATQILDCIRMPCLATPCSWR